jgi:hypothetical protein
MTWNRSSHKLETQTSELVNRNRRDDFYYRVSRQGCLRFLLHPFYQLPRFAPVGQGRSPLSDEEKREEEPQAIALNLLRENISLGTIARITGLTIAQLQQLQSEQQ